MNILHHLAGENAEVHDWVQFCKDSRLKLTIWYSIETDQSWIWILWRGLPVEYSFSIKGSFYLKMCISFLYIFFFKKWGGGSCGYENPKPFCGKRYTDTNCCQMPTNKYNQIDKWNLEKVSSSNECWPRLWFDLQRTTKHISESSPQFLLSDPVLWSMSTK